MDWSVPGRFLLLVCGADSGSLRGLDYSLFACREVCWMLCCCSFGLVLPSPTSAKQEKALVINKNY